MVSLLPRRGRNELDRFKNEMDRLFDDFISRAPHRRSLKGGEWVPAVDVSETGSEIIVYAEIPGMDPKDIDISLDGRRLTIKGERRQRQEETETSHHRIELKYGSFSRTFELTADVEQDKAEAEYTEGVLKLKLPKTKSQAAKKIDVKTM